MTRRAPLVLLLALLPALPAAQRPATTDRWIATWGAAQTLQTQAAAAPAAAPAPATQAPAAAPQTAPSGPARRFPVPRPLPSFNNQTVRMVARASAGGRAVRIRLSNAFGASSVRIGAARIARARSGSVIDPSTSRQLTFSGRPEAVLYAGQVLVSDAIDLAVPPLADLAVSLFLPAETPASTTHRFGLRTMFVASGDATAAADLSHEATTESYYWLAGIDVLAPAKGRTIVTFGDSITDGDQSTPGAIGSWPALLAARLQASPVTAHLAIVNAGISGNRLLGDNGSGLARLVNDAISQPGVAWITLLEGINDITAATRGRGATSFNEKDLIAAYQQVIAQARLRGIRVAGCTLTPFGGSNAFTPEGERIRAAVNEWIRTSGAFDAVIDFDRAVRDPQDPSRFRAEADSPDLLHPGDAGYRLMAAAIDPRVFLR